MKPKHTKHEENYIEVIIIELPIICDKEQS